MKLIFKTNLTWTLRVIILECRNASTFTATIIITIQNALTEFVVVICHACINIVLIFIILEYFLFWIETSYRFSMFTYITKANRILTSSAAVYAISMTRANYKLKSFLSFLWLISYERFISIRKLTYDPNRQHLLDYTPSSILMSYRYLHILSILCRTSRYRQDSSHSPLIKIKNWLIVWPGPWPILYGILGQFHKGLSWVG